MKQQILTATAALALLQLTACGSTGSSPGTQTGIMPGSTATTAISEQRVAISDFKRQGVRVFYTLTGGLEAVESTGYAPVWGNSENAVREAYRVAELEAKKSLNDFINRETMSSTVSVKMISQNLEHARDQKTNRFNSNLTGSSDQLVAVDEIVDREKNVQTTRDENTAVRNDALKISNTVTTTITNSNRGILGGLYLVDGQAVNDGRTIRVVMRWDRKHVEVRNQIRELMMR